MTEDQIKHMVDRFLGWRLPTNFNPDGGISYTPPMRGFGPAAHPSGPMPIGTNLLDAAQAETMVRYITEDIPTAPTPQVSEEMVDQVARAIYEEFCQIAQEEEHSNRLCPHSERYRRLARAALRAAPPARDDAAALVGWAVSVDGAIDMRTVGPTRRSAIVNWLYVGAMQFIPPSMGDEAIDRLWEQHSARMNAEVVNVSVRAIQSLARVRKEG